MNYEPPRPTVRLKVTARDVPEPNWLELYTARGRSLGRPADPAAVDEIVSRHLPDESFLLILWAAGEIYLEWYLRPSFGRPPVWHLAFRRKGVI